MSDIDDVGAFVPHGRIRLEPTGEGPLSGLTFGLKDLFDVAGAPTGAGNPDWLATHPIPAATAPLVETLLAAGATLVGKTVTDEMAWGLAGENVHYGAPRNVAAPGRVCGGSSSGSAAAVAAGLVDFAIGTDTGGSIRLPASYCGLIGLRPTHGRLSLAGAFALAPSYDAAGWFARDAETFERVGRVVLATWRTAEPPARLLIADDLFARAAPETREALAPALDRLASRFAAVERVTVAGERAPAWREVYRVLQGREAWALHRDWVERVRPRFGPGVKERFAAAPAITGDEVSAATSARKTIRAEMDALVAPGTVLALPTVPGSAPRLGAPDAEIARFRAAALEMLCPAGHAGLPQISLPVAFVDGGPVGLSLVAARGEDEALIGLAARALDG